MKTASFSELNIKLPKKMQSSIMFTCSGGSRISQGGAKQLFGIFIAKNCMKMKKYQLRGETSVAPLDP